MVKSIGSIEVSLDFTTTGYSQAKAMLEIAKALKAIQLELFEQIESAESMVIASRFECIQEELTIDKTNP